MHTATFLFLCSFCCLLCLQMEAQLPTIDWDRSLGGNNYEEMHSMTLTRDGGILLAACSASPVSGTVTVDKIGGFDIWLVKLDAAGQTEWQQRYGGSKEELAWSSQQLPNGDFLIGGQSRSGIDGNKTEDSRGGADVWIFRTDEQGNLLWQKTLGGTTDDILNGGIVPTDDGGMIFAATSNSNRSGEKSEDSRGGNDFWIGKIDRNGNLAWDKTYGGDQNELVQVIYPLQDGNFLVGGFSKSGISGDKTEALRAGRQNDMWLLKINKNGDLLWQKTLGGNWEESLHDIVQAADGTIYLTGFSGSDVGFDKTHPTYGNLDYWVVALDEQGQKLWDKNFGGNKPDVAFDIRINALGNLVVGGYANSGNSGVKSSESKGLNDYWIVYLTPEGELIWEISFGGDGRDGLEEMEIMEDGSLVFAGQTPSENNGDKSEPSNGFNDVWIVKTLCQLQPTMPDSQRLICRDQLTTLSADFDNCYQCVYNWSHGASDSLTQFPTPTSDAIQTVKAIDANGCIDYDSTQLYYAIPNAINMDFTKANCEIELAVRNIQGGTPPYRYNVVGEDFFASEENPIRIKPGKPYEIVVRDSFGCTYAEDIQLGYDTDLKVELGAQYVIQLGETIELQAVTNTPIDSVQWINTYDLSCENCAFTEFTPLESTTIQAIVYDEFGCRATDIVDVFVDRPYEIYVPNVFTPNGDGRNEYFSIFTGDDVAKVNYLRVLHRSGRTIYNIENPPINQPNMGWNGMARGQFLPNGVYVYVTEVEFIDGKIKHFMGDVTLMR